MKFELIRVKENKYIFFFYVFMIENDDLRVRLCNNFIILV